MISAELANIPRKEPTVRKINIQTPALKLGPSIKIKLTSNIWLFSIAKKAPKIARPMIIKNFRNSQIPRKVLSQIRLPMRLL